MKSTIIKHLSLSDRVAIELGINEGKSCKEIASSIQKDPTTVSKEVKRSRSEKKPNYAIVERVYIDKLPLCKSQVRFPYVCNNCVTRTRCKKLKHYYRAQDAHIKYRYDLSDSRKGYDISIEELNTLDILLKPLINKGQSLYHICKTNQLGKSINTIYNYTDDGLFSFSNIDLPRKVRYKPRKKSIDTIVKPSKIGRTYTDFLQFMNDNDISNYVQIDTVEGTQDDSKCLLTILFVTQRLMLIRLLPKQQANYVTGVFNNLQKKLGFDSFKLLFNVCLTDNGSEFSDILGLDTCFLTGNARMNLFFCDPFQSQQKGALEKNHEFIRYILPKGSSFANLNNRKVKLIESHINSYLRKSLNNKTPYELFLFSYGASICRSLSLSTVHPNDVILKPSLIR